MVGTSDLLIEEKKVEGLLSEAVKKMRQPPVSLLTSCYDPIMIDNLFSSCEYEKAYVTGDVSSAVNMTNRIKVTPSDDKYINFREATIHCEWKVTDTAAAVAINEKSTFEWPLAFWKKVQLELNGSVVETKNNFAHVLQDVIMTRYSEDWVKTFGTANFCSFYDTGSDALGWTAGSATVAYGMLHSAALDGSNAKTGWEIQKVDDLSTATQIIAANTAHTVTNAGALERRTILYNATTNYIQFNIPLSLIFDVIKNLTPLGCAKIKTMRVNLTNFNHISDFVTSSAETTATNWAFAWNTGVNFYLRYPLMTPNDAGRKELLKHRSDYCVIPYTVFHSPPNIRTDIATASTYTDTYDCQSPIGLFHYSYVNTANASMTTSKHIYSGNFTLKRTSVNGRQVDDIEMVNLWSARKYRNALSEYFNCMGTDDGTMGSSIVNFKTFYDIHPCIATNLSPHRFKTNQGYLPRCDGSMVEVRQLLTTTTITDLYMVTILECEGLLKLTSDKALCLLNNNMAVA